MFFRLIEMSAQRFLGNFLQIGVDRCVNAKAFIHRAIPADGRDDLLANVINRVGLPAARFADRQSRHVPPSRSRIFRR